MGTGARPRDRAAGRTRHLGGLVGVGLLATALSGLACGSKTATSDGGQDLIPKTDVPELGTGIHSSCPTTLPGPAMTRVGWHGGVAFCIDDTEVTNSQYQAFLTVAAAMPQAPTPRCAWNTELTPAATGSGCAAFDPAGRPDHPVVCVDWCDAEAYCR